MPAPSGILIGRYHELAALSAALDAARAGRGGLLLVPGEAGVGKTRLVEAAIAESTLPFLVGRATAQTTPPYGPIVAALRDYLRQVPDGLAQCGSLSGYLALILPELGSAPAGGDRAALIEAMRGAFESIARRQPSVVFLDDLQWADNATLEVLPKLAESLANLPLLVIGTYRSDEVPRGHPLRQIRTELRRLRQLRELAVEPLDRQATAELAGRMFGQALSPSLAASLHSRTQGIPLFVEELVDALSTNRTVRAGKAGLELVPGHNVPIPETLRDAVLLRLDALPASARKVIEIAAVLGPDFDLATVCELAAEDDAIDDLLQRNWIVETHAGRATFRHALMHEAVYNQIPWTRRRSWHRDAALRLAAKDAHPQVIAEHWLAARELDLAREALLAYVEISCGLHAYRDATVAIHRALELWPKGVEEARRLEVLTRLGRCAQLSGLLSDAIQAWREVAERRQLDPDKFPLAQIERQLASAYELQGAWEQALAARQKAAEAYAASRHPEEAATERLLAAAHLRSAGRFNSALEFISDARQEAEQTQRLDLLARLMGLEGNVRARMGEFETGLAMVRTGLALALAHGMTGPIAEVYQRLADGLEHAGDYAGAKDTYEDAFNFCQMNAIPATGQVCMACLSAVLLHTGEWERAITICRDVLASAHSPHPALVTASCILGLIYALRGQTSRARPLLLEALASSRRIELAAAELLSIWGHAVLDDCNNAGESAAGHCHALLACWQTIEDRHYAIAALRWAAARLSLMQASTEARACANALATIAATTGLPEALSALAHALGEVALLDGDTDQAVRQFQQSLDLLQNTESPFERAETHLRAGAVLVGMGQRDSAVDHFVHAHRIAGKLGAKTIAAQAAQELAAIGEKAQQRLGRRAKGVSQRGGLTRRQLEILQLVANGQTSHEIARALFVSPRTIEMHVGDILARLDCHTRSEAVRKAGELGLLKSS